MTRPDVCVLGADVEGLVAAAHLARAGRSVVLVDERETPGGAHATFEFHPGFHAPGAWPDGSLTRRDALAPLELERHGLTWRASPALWVPRDGGGALLGAGPDATRGFAADELARLAATRARLARFAPLVRGVFGEAPPDAADPSVPELLGLAQKALRLRRLGRDDMFALARLLPSSAQDWTDDDFTDEALRTAWIAPTLCGTVLGPRAPGTGGLVFLRQVLAEGEPNGGPAALVKALVARVRELGVETRLGRRVERLAWENGRVTGVEHAGETLRAGHVLSTLSPRRTLLDLVAPGTLPDSLEDAVRTFRSRGTTAVLWLALERAPRLRGHEDAAVEHALSAATRIALEKAADGLKYAAAPTTPWIELRVPSHADPAIAPAGKAVAVVACHTVPHTIASRGGWTDERRAALTETLLGALEAIAPGTRAGVVASELLLPADLESRFGLDGGHLFQGELALDQLWLQRPSLALCRYRTPVEGLVLGGAASHPGGPFLGAAGSLAATTMLRG